MARFVVEHGRKYPDRKELKEITPWRRKLLIYFLALPALLALQQEPLALPQVLVLPLPARQVLRVPAQLLHQQQELQPLAFLLQVPALAPQEQDSHQPSREHLEYLIQADRNRVCQSPYLHSSEKQESQ